MNFSENVHCSMMIITMMAGRGHAEDGAEVRAPRPRLRGHVRGLRGGRGPGARDRGLDQMGGGVQVIMYRPDVHSGQYVKWLGIFLTSQVV